ncbi:MAG: type II secretion system protein GspN [Bdellovibrionota bacterium]
MTKKNLLYAAMSLVLTIFFIYIFFPFSLLKEVGISKLQVYLNQTNMGLNIEAQSLSSYWFTGVKIKNIQITNPHQEKSSLKIDEVTVRVSVLPILLGKINVNSDVKIANGDASLFVSLSLLDLISNKTNIKKASADFDNFKLDEIFKQFINIIKHSNNPSLSMLIPLIANSSVGGFLNGSVYYRSGENNTSFANLKIKNAYLDLQNATLDIPKQIFTTANVDMQYEPPTLTIKKDTAFTAQNMSFSAIGNIQNLNVRGKKSSVNLKLGILLSGQIEKNFAFLLPQLLKCPTSSILGGIMNVNLSGSTDKLECHQ